MWIGLFAIGIGVGCIGALVGSGGGFILVPVLLLAFGMVPSVAAGTSLAMIVVNASSASIAFHRQGRVDYLSAAYFIAASVPGAVIGGLVSPYLPAKWFSVAFGVMLALVAARMVLSGRRKGQEAERETGGAEKPGGGLLGFRVSRVLVRGGDTFSYSYNLPLALAISFGAGFISAVLGVGGGIIRTPLMIAVLAFPIHVATATAQVILLFTAIAGAATHFFQGDINLAYAIPLAAGGLVGAASGAWLSRRLNANVLKIVIAVSMLAVAARMIASA